MIEKNEILETVKQIRELINRTEEKCNCEENNDFAITYVKRPSRKIIEQARKQKDLPIKYVKIQPLKMQRKKILKKKEEKEILKAIKQIRELINRIEEKCNCEGNIDFAFTYEMQGKKIRKRNKRRRK